MSRANWIDLLRRRATRRRCARDRRWDTFRNAGRVPRLFERLEPRMLLSGTPAMDYVATSAAWFARALNASVVPPSTEVGTFVSATGQDGVPAADLPSASGWLVRLTEQAVADGAAVPNAEHYLDRLDADFQIVRGLGLPGQLLVQSFAPDAVARTALADNPYVASFEANRSILGPQGDGPDDPLFGQQWGLENSGQTGGTTDADIDALGAWDIATGSTQVVVGVVDSGVDYTHPDLYLNVGINQGEIPDPFASQIAQIDVDGDGLVTFYDLNDPHNIGLVAERADDGNDYLDGGDLLQAWSDNVDTDGNGYRDDLIGWDFQGNDNNPRDEHRHGTHVAGTIAALGDNGLGVAGINRSVSLLPLKFLNANNQGFLSDAVTAVNYATLMRTTYGMNVRVTNNSWVSGTEPDEALRDAIEAAGAADILSVAAAGNGDILGRGIDMDADPFYPAAYDLDNILSVAATDHNDKLARFSNYGLQTVDIAAPGVAILSTEPGGQYGSRNGTSMAAPHVTGVAALVWSRVPHATVAEVREAILQGADPIAGLQSKIAGGRRLNAHGALLVDTAAPLAALVSAQDVTGPGVTNVDVTVQYRDDQAVDETTLGAADLIVTRIWDGVELAGVTLQSADVQDGRRTVTAVYRVPAPDGTWGAADQGDYRISLHADEVFDTVYNAAHAVALGTFNVDTTEGLFRADSLLDAPDAVPGDGSSDDGGGHSTLRAAIMESNASVGQANVIRLRPATYQMTVAGSGEDQAATGDLDVTDSVTIRGAGPSQTILDAAGLDRVFHVPAGATLTLSDVTITGGSEDFGGGILVEAGGTLILTNVSIEGNAAETSGGAVANWGDATVRQSLLVGNMATGSGGAVWNAGQAELLNVTISGNQSMGLGGGLSNVASGTVALTNVTVAENIAASGGGLHNAGTANVWNTILATNTAATGPDVAGTVASLGHNLVSEDGGSDGWLESDLMDTEPLLGPLQDNTGSTLTHLPAAASPAIDAGDNDCLDEIDGQDQRGIPRPQDAGGAPGAVVDIGAAERYHAEISGMRFRDLDGNGRRDAGEEPLEGLKVYLDLNQNSRADPNEPFDRTDETGFYQLESLEPGTYTVVEEELAGWTDTFVHYGLEFAQISLGRQKLPTPDHISSLASCGWSLAFASDAANFVPGDTNGVSDIFVYDVEHGDMQRVSISQTGDQANGSSYSPACGPDLAFVSDATNLVLEDTNGVSDIFVYDFDEQTVTRVSVSSEGAQTDSSSFSPAVGNAFVAFASDATNLVPDDSNGQTDIFVHDRQMGNVERVSVSSEGVQADGASYSPAISPDDRFVTFESDATNLVPGDTNDARDIFVYDRQTGAIERVSLSSEGDPGDGNSFSPKLSPDGRFVTFQSDATNLVPADSNGLRDIFIYDRQEDVVQRVSVSQEAIEADGDSHSPSFSSDGQFVIFASDATNFVSADTNGKTDIFVYDRQTGIIERAGLSDTGTQADGSCFSPAFVGDAVAFLSEATNLVPGDVNDAVDIFVYSRQWREITRVGIPLNGPSYSPSLSADGRFVSFVSTATNLLPGENVPEESIFVYDRQEDTIERLNIPHVGYEWESYLDFGQVPELSPDGRFVAFGSYAANLVPGDTNAANDLFLYDRQTGTIHLVSIAYDGSSADYRSGSPAWSADGRFLAFMSRAANLVPGDTNSQEDVFVYDRQTDTIERVSIAHDGAQGDGGSSYPALSSDGRFVAFTSDATNLVPGDTNQGGDIFVFDRQNQHVERVSVTHDGTQGNGTGSQDWPAPSISGDGRFVAFGSDANNLVPGDTNHTDDIFVYDGQERTIQRVSMAHDGAQGNSTSYSPAISADGRFVAFMSDATNLLPGESTNQVYLYDRQEHTIRRMSSSPDAVFANGDCLSLAFSGTGLYVAFETAATNLGGAWSGPYDWEQPDIFVNVNTAAQPSGEAWSVFLGAGESVAGIDFGSRPLPGLIRGRLFSDLDADGTTDANEFGLAGWTVFLDDNRNGLLDSGEQSQQTNIFGEYALEEVEPLATHTVAVVIENYWAQTAPRPADGGVWVIDLGAGELRTGVDFALNYHGPGGQDVDVIRGRLFRDLNGNGREDPGDTGMAGQTVYVDVNNNGVLDGDDIPALTQADNPATAEVDETGWYSFEGLAHGTYTVRVDPANGSTQTTPLDPQLSALHYGTGILDQSQAVATGDLDGDGDDDLIVAHGNYVSWLANDGNGLFAAPVPIPAYSGVGAWSLAVADFDSDDDLDLAVTNYLSSDVSVLLNDGHAGFTLGANYAVGVYPHAVAAGDLDRDGDVDLAVALEWDGKVAILRNGGQGAFTLDAAKPASGTNPFAVVSGHFNDDNADGRSDDLDALDLVLANFGNPQNATDVGNVAVLLNNGSGSYTTRLPVPAGENPACVAAADVDLDGDLDLAVASFGSNDVAILLNVGNGSFARWTDTFPAGAGPYAITAGDLDHDGDPDLIVTNGTEDHLAVLRNDSKDGAITFAAPQSVGVANFPDSLSFGVAVQDLNDDGDLDLAVANGTGNNVSVMLNQVVQGAHRVTLNGLDTFTALDFGLQPDNAPPTISVLDDRTTPEGRTVGPLPLTIGDLETPPDELVVAAASDNLTLVPIANLVLAGSGSQRTLTVTPAANQTGVATITVSVSDGIHTTSESFQLTITPMMTVTSFAATRTGFAAELSHDVAASVLNLYDQGGVLGPADVTLTGATVGPVRGSLVVAPDLRQITFIRTGGPLEADTYAVTLLSGANAFCDAAGNLLDGNGDGTAGDDYTASFVVPAAAATQVTVSLPDFARGYGQSVNLPANDLAAGLPLQLSNGLGVSRLQLTLRYDPSLLEVQALTLNDSVAGGDAEAEFQVVVPGEATLDITATGSFAAASGPLIVGTFTAAVPATAAYGAKHVLDITDLHVFDDGTEPAELPAVDDDAIHVAAYFGDNNGSRTYNAPDVTLNQRLIGLINTGLSAYQLADPLLLADITRNGQLQANDTVSIQRVIGQVPVANVPALPSGLTPPAATGADPKIYIPRDMSGILGDTVTVPVRLLVTEAAGITLSGFDLAIEFDPARFTVSDARLGSLVGGLDFVGLWTNPAPGKLIYTASSATGTGLLPEGTEGSLVTLTLMIEAGAAVGPAAVNLLASFQTTATAAFDAELNELVLTPAPSNAADDSVDGLLTVTGSSFELPPAQNPAQPLDTNGDGDVTPADVLAVINYLNGGLPQDASVLYVLPGRPITYGDVNGDRRITAQDVLEVVNQLNARVTPGSEGETHEAALWWLWNEEQETESLWDLLAENRLGRDESRTDFNPFGTE